MRHFAVALLAGCAALTAAIVAVPLVAGANVAKSAAPVTKSAHVAYETCPAKTTLLTASVPRLTYSVGQPVRVRITITSTGDTTCGYAALNGTPSPPPGQLVVGQCGEVSIQVDNLKSQNIYPGRVSINCPDIIGPDLPAHGRLTATATWNQSAYPLQYTQPWVPHPAPPGHYRLSLAGKVTFPIAVKTTVHTP